MRNSWIKRIFPLLAVSLLTPWPVAYAYDFTNGVTDHHGVQIEVAETSAAPTWSAFGGAIGGVTPGDLFYIDATDNPLDTRVNLYITNADELIHCYRYLILKVGVYTESNGGQWEKATRANGEPFPDTFITMRDAQVSFTLPGLVRYKITIDSGSFYCTTTNPGKGNLSPQFYLTVDSPE